MAESIEAEENRREAERRARLGTLEQVLDCHVADLRARGYVSARAVESTFERWVTKTFPELCQSLAKTVTSQDIQKILANLFNRGLRRGVSLLRSYRRRACHSKPGYLEIGAHVSRGFLQPREKSPARGFARLACAKLYEPLARCLVGCNRLAQGGRRCLDQFTAGRLLIHHHSRQERMNLTEPQPPRLPMPAVTQSQSSLSESRDGLRQIRAAAR
jgi:hypothetical protein